MKFASVAVVVIGLSVSLFDETFGARFYKHVPPKYKLAKNPIHHQIVIPVKGNHQKFKKPAPVLTTPVRQQYHNNHKTIKSRKGKVPTRQFRQSMLHKLSNSIYPSYLSADRVLQSFFNLL